MMNPEGKPLRMVPPHIEAQNYGIMLSNLAIAESNLVRAGDKSARTHFIAIVKELERIYGFEFRIVGEDSGQNALSKPE